MNRLAGRDAMGWSRSQTESDASAEPVNRLDWHRLLNGLEPSMKRGRDVLSALRRLNRKSGHASRVGKDRLGLLVVRRIAIRNIASLSTLPIK